VEITDVIFNLPGKPVTGEQESKKHDDKNKKDLPKSPLELGLVPPYNGTESPDESGEDQFPGEEPPSKSVPGEIPEPDAESGVESNTSGGDTADREMPPRQEGPKPPLINLNKIVTAAMKKGRPVCDLRDVLGLGLDPSVMPTNPEGAQLTPPSLLDQALARGQSQSDETERRLRLLTEARPAEPDSTHCDEAFETKGQTEDRIQRWIGRARNQKQKPSPTQSPTGQKHVHEVPQTAAPNNDAGREKKKRTRITFDLNVTKPTKSVRDRLGPPLNLDWSWPRARKLGIYPWNRRIEGLEPAEPEDMTNQELIDKLKRMRTYQEEKEPNTDELGSTDGSEEDQQ
jgi:hypothetical protein